MGIRQRIFTEWPDREIRSLRIFLKWREKEEGIELFVNYARIHVSNEWRNPHLTAVELGNYLSNSKETLHRLTLVPISIVPVSEHEKRKTKWSMSRIVDLHIFPPSSYVPESSAYNMNELSEPNILGFNAGYKFYESGARGSNNPCREELLMFKIDPNIYTLERSM